MILYPKRILKDYENNRLDKKTAINHLIIIINKTKTTEKRIESIHILEAIGIYGEFLYEYFENLMISDSNELIRNLAIAIIKKYYIDKAFEPMCWAYRHESSLKCILTIISTLGNINSPLAREYLINELKNTELSGYSKSFLRLIKENKLINYSTQNLASMLINYYIIKKFIEKFQRLNYKVKDGYVNELDFSCIGHNIFNWNIIDRIPTYIGLLQKLEKLDLKVNKIKSIPDSIGELLYLKELDLSNNQIQIIPESFSAMESLNILNLRHNNLTSLPNAIGKLENLKYLDISHNKLMNLPKSFKNLGNLKYLKLYGNQFEEIPAHLGNLNKLKYLEAGLNSITAIEKNLLSISSLEKLGLGSNKLNIHTLYKLKSLENLQEIDLYDNNIRELPKSFRELNQIKKLSIHNNQLRDIPENFSHLNSIENLDLSWNNFKVIPDALFRLQTLKKLNLSGNKIHSIPNIIFKLKNLKEIDLSYNKIQKKPILITKMENKGISLKI